MRYKDNIDKIEQEIAAMVRDAPVDIAVGKVQVTFSWLLTFGPG